MLSDPRLNIKLHNAILTHELGNLMDAAGVEGSVRFTVNGYRRPWISLQRMARQTTVLPCDFLGSPNIIVSFSHVVRDTMKHPLQLYHVRTAYFSRNLDRIVLTIYLRPAKWISRAEVTAYLHEKGA